MQIESVEEYNQQKVLQAFAECKVSESHFTGSTGYGYNDRGREKLDELFGYIFGAEDALVRHSFTGGTHTLATALFAILRPQDCVLSVTGEPYDTISDVIDCKGKHMGCLKEFGVSFECLNYESDSQKYFQKIRSKLNEKSFRMVYIQRSRGYSLRDSLSVEKIGEIVSLAKSINPEIIVMVDNCYGEFVQKHEPPEYGADLTVGSLIKNPGGGIAPTGGYIVGRKELIELCAYRLTAPGIGKEVGATLDVCRQLFMGIYNAPHVVAEALKTAVFSATVFEMLGYDVSPKPCESRVDIVQSIVLKTPKKLVSFCKGIQEGSPVDSFVSPEPWDMPGYEDPVIMAAGTFISGASIELSADGPLRPPYCVWMQGGTNFFASKIGVMKAVERVLNS